LLVDQSRDVSDVRQPATAFDTFCLKFLAARSFESQRDAVAALGWTPHQPHAKVLDKKSGKQSFLLIIIDFRFIDSVYAVHAVQIES
jgi:hypothetical protein